MSTKSRVLWACTGLAAVLAIYTLTFSSAQGFARWIPAVATIFIGWLALRNRNS